MKTQPILLSIRKREARSNATAKAIFIVFGLLFVAGTGATIASAF